MGATPALGRHGPGKQLTRRRKYGYSTNEASRVFRKRYYVAASVRLGVSIRLIQEFQHGTD